MSLKFFSIAKSLPVDIFTPAGSEEVDDYQEIIDDFGCNILILKGKKNIQAEIQSYKESTDMASIVARLIDLGVDFGSIPVEIEDEVVDVSDIQAKSPQDLLDVVSRLDENIKLFEQYKKDLEAKKEVKEEVSNNE